MLSVKTGYFYQSGLSGRSPVCQQEVKLVVISAVATSLVDAVGPAYLDVRGPRELAVAGVQPAHDLGLRAARHAALVGPVVGGDDVLQRVAS